MQQKVDSMRPLTRRSTSGQTLWPMNSPVLAPLGLATLLSVGVLAQASQALAYLLPGAFLVKRADAALGKRSFQVVLSGRVRTGAGADSSGSVDTPDSIIAIGARYTFDPKRRFARLAINGADGTKASFVLGSAPEGGPALMPSHLERLVLSRLFAQGSVGALADELRIDLESRRLGLIGTTVTDVLGGGSPDAAELVLDHETSQVLQVSLTERAGRRVRIELSEWTAGDFGGGGASFPRRIRIYEGGRWVRDLEAEPPEAL